MSDLPHIEEILKQSERTRKRLARIRAYKEYATVLNAENDVRRAQKSHNARNSPEIERLRAALRGQRHARA